MKPFNLSDLVRKTVALHHNDCEILYNDTQNDIEVTGDKKLMGRIITNILLNAQQAQARGDMPVKVIVTIREIGKNIQLSIADNGIGISKDIVDKIFLPGFSTKKTGSGIGLAVAKHGIEQSGGQLWVESAIGKGTTFYIEIPLANS
jgi:signal transduction histidine kinase